MQRRRIYLHQLDNICSCSVQLSVSLHRCRTPSIDNGVQYVTTSVLFTLDASAMTFSFSTWAATVVNGLGLNVTVKYLYSSPILCLGLVASTPHADGGCSHLNRAKDNLSKCGLVHCALTVVFTLIKELEFYGQSVLGPGRENALREIRWISLRISFTAASRGQKSGPLMNTRTDYEILSYISAYKHCFETWKYSVETCSWMLPNHLEPNPLAAEPTAIIILHSGICDAALHGYDTCRSGSTCAHFNRCKHEVTTRRAHVKLI